MKERKSKKRTLNFVCEKCDAAFSRKYNFNRHLETHKGCIKQFECPKCDKCFSRQDTYKRHLKEAHSKEGIKYKCKACNKSYIRKHQYDLHLQYFHSEKSTQDGFLIDNRPYFECYKCGVKCRSKYDIKTHIFTVHEDPEFECNTCGCRFKHKFSLIGHFKKRCLSLKYKKNKQCSLCSIPFLRKIDVFQHYKESHSINFLTQDLSFPSDKEFLSWKRQMENSTNSKFRITYIYRQSLKTMHVYSCHRSGLRVVKSSYSSKRSKIGSKKLGAICPAQIKLCRSNVDFTCAVSFLSTHVGHDPTSEAEFEYLLHRRKIRKLLAKKKAAGVSVTGADLVGESTNETELTDDINSSAHDAQPFSDGDVRSIDAFVNHHSHSVIYYKNQRELLERSHDLVLVFMSFTQKSLLRKYGNNAIAVVSSRGMNVCNLIVYMMLVVDYDNESLPVAFAVGNGSDVELVDTFFSTVKKKIGILQPKILMTDVQESCYNSWKIIMGAPRFHLFCTWHVRQAWKKNFRYIKNKCERKIMCETLCKLIAEYDANVFDRILQALLDKRDDDVSEFLTYFRNQFVDRIPCWAYRHWKYAGVSISKHVETFHRSFKHTQEHRRAKNMYTRLTMIMQFLETRLQSVLTKEFRPEITLRLKGLRKAHDKYVTFAVNNNNFIKVRRNEDGWLIRSLQMSDGGQSQDIFRVQRLHEICPVVKEEGCVKCNLACAECQVCAHLYCCTCAENTVKNYMCEHIHAVVSMFWINFVISKFESDENSIAPESTIHDTPTHESFSAPSLAVCSTPVCENSAELKFDKFGKPLSVNQLGMHAEHLSKKLSEIITLVSTDDQLRLLSKLLEPISPVVLSSVNTAFLCNESTNDSRK